MEKKVVIGGTFDLLHKGHKALIKRAFKLGEVFIGLTSDSLAKKLKKRKVENFRKRKRELKKFIENELNKKAKIFKIEDKFGPTLKKDFDFIVVSPETLKTALLINKKRKKKNKKKIKIVKIKFVLAEDGKPISSTRILKGEIDKEGRLLKWIAISGSWREMNKKLEKDIRENVKKIFLKGSGIVTGGALNVDFVATDEALKLDPKAKRIKIFLPATLKIYSAHLRKRARQRVITKKQAKNLISQLRKIKRINPSAIIENKKIKKINEKAYHHRNSKIIKAADKLIAFWVNKTPGTKDAIKKAKAKGIPVKVFNYKI